MRKRSPRVCTVCVPVRSRALARPRAPRARRCDPLCDGAARADRCASARAALSALRERVVCGREVSPVWRVEFVAELALLVSLSCIRRLDLRFVFKNVKLISFSFSTVGSGNVRCTYNLASSLASRALPLGRLAPRHAVYNVDMRSPPMGALSSHSSE